MLSKDYYDYQEIIKAVKENESEENINRLGEWFEHNGSNYWNGECWNVKELGDANLYPVYKLVDEENEEYEIAGYEIKW